MTACGSSSYCSAAAVDAAVDVETEEASAKPDRSVHTKKSGDTALFCMCLGKSRLLIFRCPSVFTFLPVFYQFFIDLTLFWHLSPFQAFLIYFIDAVSLYHKHLLSQPSLPSYYNICHEPHFRHI